MALAQKLENDNLKLVCKRSVEELHQLFVAWFQGTDPREALTTSLMECLAPEFSHVAPNGQFLQGRGILIGHLQDKYGCYKNRLFQIEIYDVRLLWQDSTGSKCLCTYEEWQSWLPDNAQQISPDGLSNTDDSDPSASSSEVHQFGRLSTCLLEKKPHTVPGASEYRWIHVHETWLEAESPQHEKPGADAASFLGDETILTGPVEYHKMAAARSPPNMLDSAGSESSEETGVMPRGSFPVAANLPLMEPTSSQEDDEDDNKHDDNDNEDTDEPTESDEDGGVEGERHLLMLMSTQSLSRDQMTRQDQARNALESSGIAFYELDGANPEERENRNSLFDLSGKWGQYPLFFLVDTAGSTTFWGTFEYFIASHSSGNLAQDIIAGGASASMLETDDLENCEPPPSNKEARALDNSNSSSSDEDESDEDRNMVPVATAAALGAAGTAAAMSKAEQDEDKDKGKDKREITAKENVPRDNVPMPAAAPQNSTLILLVSTQTLSRDQKQRQEDAAKLLDDHQVQYETLDGSAKANRERRNQLFRVSTFWGKYPQMFHHNAANNTTTYWGNWEELESSSQRGTLARDLAFVQPPSSAAADNDESESSSNMNNNSSNGDLDALEPAATVAALASVNPASPVQSSQDQAYTKGVLLLISNQSLSREQMSRQDKARQYLTESKVPYQELDGSARDFRQKRNELFKVSRLWGRYPQIFIVKDGDDGQDDIIFWGDWEKMDSSYSQGTFAQEIIAASGAVPQEQAPIESKKELNGAPVWAAAGAGAAVGAAAVAAKDDESSSSSDEEGGDSTEVDEDDDFLQRSAGILEFEDDGQGGNVPTKEEKKQDEEEMDEEQFKAVVSAVSPIPQDVSSKRHVSSKLLKYAKPLTWENSLVGLSVNGFDIGTSQGPIADENWYKEVTDALETVSQYSGSTMPRRKLTLPEMVFPTAHVALEGHGFWLSWDVLDALEEWARAHSEIAANSADSNRGVSVLKSKDAKLWEKKSKEMNTQTPSVFHYDWSFSTPFAGKVEGGEWVELDESGMRVELLKDTSIPILFFDEITLFEDDLHDNGQVLFNVKVRVMPSCAYVLARLWLRVDNVVVRVRETRLLVDFFGMTPAVFRDVTWRECYWENLKQHQLPTDVRSWNFDGQETPEWHEMLRKIPEVDPPDDIFKYAMLEPTKPSHTVVKQLNSSVAEALSAENSLEYLEV